MDGWLPVQLDRGDSGVRIDRVLLRHLPAVLRVSRNRIQKLIEEGGVLINGAPAGRVARRVTEGDDIRVRIEAPQPRVRPAAEPMPLAVLHEDDHLLIVDKPAGIVSHPSFGHAGGTLLNGVLWHTRQRDAAAEPALLTRLDKFTSGAILVAKRPAVFTALQRAMRAHRIDKDYLAIVHGRPVPARGTIDAALDRDPWDRRRVAVTDRGGQPAITRYERIAVSTIPAGTAPPPTGGGDRTTSLPATDRRQPSLRPAGRVSRPAGRPDRPPVQPCVSLLKCRLVTGRMHQIRVHLSSKGWPIVGDAAYGDRARQDGPVLGRQALHAWRISFAHPISNEPIVAIAPLPDDMAGLLATLGMAIDRDRESGVGPVRRSLGEGGSRES